MYTKAVVDSTMGGTPVIRLYATINRFQEHYYLTKQGSTIDRNVRFRHNPVIKKRIEFKTNREAISLLKSLFQTRKSKRHYQAPTVVHYDLISQKKDITNE